MAFIGDHTWDYFFVINEFEWWKFCFNGSSSDNIDWRLVASATDWVTFTPSCDVYE